MKRSFIVVSLLLPALLAGCASDREVQALRSDSLSVERQGMRREQELDERLQALNERITQFEKSNSEVRRDLAKAVTTNEELRSEIQRLRGSVQESRHGASQRNTPPGDPFASRPVDSSRPVLQPGLTPPPIAQPPTGPPSAPAPAPAPAPVAPSAAAQPPGTGLSQNQTPGTPGAPPSTQPSLQASLPPPAPPPVTSPPPSLIPRSPTPPPTSSATPPESPDNAAAERLYQRALKDQQQGNYEVAIVLYKQLQRQYPKSSYASQAQYGIGDALYAQKQYEASIVAFDEVIQKYPQNNKTPAAILKQGLAFAELKDQRNAKFFLQQLQKKYPNSPEAQQAAEKLKQLR